MKYNILPHLHLCLYCSNTRTVLGGGNKSKYYADAIPFCFEGKHMQKFPNNTIHGTFPSEGAVRFGSQKMRHGSRFHRQKWAQAGLSHTEPYSSCTRLAVLLRWSTETPERVPANSSYTCPPLIGRQNCKFRATWG